MNITRSRNGVHLAPAQGLNRLFDDIWRTALVPATVTAGYTPAVDALDTPEAYVVAMDIPGIDPATIEVTAKGDELTVTGERLAPQLPEHSTWIVCERPVGGFKRSVSLPVAVDIDAIAAEAKHGVLTIRLPKRAETLPKQISVEIVK